MANCSTCGKELAENEIYNTNGYIQCAQCAGATQAPADNPAPAYQPAYAPAYAAPQMPYPQPKTPAKGSNGWAKFIKVIAIIAIILEVLASLGGGIASMVILGDEVGAALGILAGIGIMLGGILAAFISNAFIMCFAHMADDVSAIRNTFNQ